MKYLVLHIILLCCTTLSSAQRQFGVCDSTFYPYNTDTGLVAGRNHLWYQTSSGLNLAYDFTSTDTNKYIRDFDIIRPDLWYTLTGDKTIGGESFLYKSTNRGLTWTRDTIFYSASNADTSAGIHYHYSVSNVQRLGTDTIVLFIGYYESGIVYSTDGGSTWTTWFRSMWLAHYQGILECDDHYFLWSYTGDGFRASMFSFPKNVLFSPDTGLIPTPWYPGGNYNPGCYNGTPPGCIYVPSVANRCEQYQFFADTLSDACAALNAAFVSDVAVAAEFHLWPNPAKEIVWIEFPGVDNSSIRRIKISDLMSREISLPGAGYHGSKLSFSVQHLPPGMYVLQLTTSDGKSIRKKFVKN